MIIYVSKKYLCICVSIYQEISLLISNVFPSNYSFFPFVVWSLNCVCPALCESMDCSMPGFPVLHYLLDFAQTHVHWVVDAIQPSHPWSPPSLPALNLSQHQGLFQWVGSSHQVACGRLNNCPQRYAHFNPWNLWILLYMTRLTLYM